MQVVSRIKELCRLNNTSLARVERALGFANGSMCKWDEKIPSVERMAKVADHFGVTLDSLTGRGATMEEITGIRDVYLSMARNAQDKGIDVADLELLMEAASSIRNKRDAR